MSILISIYRLLIRLSLLTVFLAQPGFAQAAPPTLHIAHCLYGCPQGAAANSDLLIRNLYAISVSQQSGQADWAAYRVLAGTVGVASFLPRQWQEDPLLHPGSGLEQVEPEQRGRLVPMSSFAATSFWPDINLLPNLAIMQRDMRLGSWSRLEQAINRLADSGSDVYVIAGPIYSLQNGFSRDPALTEISQVPTAFFKLVATSDGQFASFIFDQNLAPHARYCDQQREPEAIELASGLILFPLAANKLLNTLASELGC